MHQKLAAGRRAHRLDEDVQVGRRRRPARGRHGRACQPEWFYKGNGGIRGRLRPAARQSPDFASDHGEEPETRRLLSHRRPRHAAPARLRHRQRVLRPRHRAAQLSTSWRTRSCASAASGPELRTGALPAHMEGTSRIRRGGAVLWQKPFLTGEGNMCHTFANLEYHHFKYRQHRRPGDVHLHFFGTATLSFVDGIRVEPGETSRSTCRRWARRSPIRWPSNAVSHDGVAHSNGTSDLGATMNERRSEHRWPPRLRLARGLLLGGCSGRDTRDESHRARLQPDRRRERMAHREHRVDQARPQPTHGIDAAVLRRAAEAGKPDQGAALLHRAEGRRHRLLAGGGNRLGNGAAGSQGREHPGDPHRPRGRRQRRLAVSVSFIGSDFVEEGRKAGRWLLENTKDTQRRRQHRRAAGHGGLRARPIDRKKGFEEIIAADPRFKIIRSQTGDFTRAKGKEVMEAFLKAEGKKINVLFAHNDDMAIGAIQAIEEAGLKPGKDITIISIDAVKGAFEAMIAGKLNVTVECSPLLGPQLMPAVKDVVAGKPIPSASSPRNRCSRWRRPRRCSRRANTEVGAPVSRRQ